MRTFLGITIMVVCVFTAWSTEPTVSKAAYTVSMNPHTMMLNATNLPQTHYDDYSTIF